MMYNDLIEIKKSPISGYGIFARKNFNVGDLIDESPCLVKPNGAWGSATEDYVFSRGKLTSLPLSTTALFNHSADPNARHELTNGLKIIRVFAAKPVKKGEEICISYGPHYFSSRDLKQK